MSNNEVLAFRNDVQKVLWDFELCGQISDGHWENATPYDHWKIWCDAKTIVDPDNVGRTFYARKDNYNLVNKDLLDVVAGRMINHVRTYLAYGYEVTKALECVHGLQVGVLDVPRHWKETLSPANYVAKALIVIDRIGEAQLVAKLAEDTFGLPELKAELKDMKAIIKMWRKEDAR